VTRQADPAPITPYSGTLWAGTRVGILGGSFNPAHEGHRYISRLALAALGLDWVWWLVSPQNPLKRGSDMATLAVRLDGAATAAAHPRIVATGLEAALGTRYTADTLTVLTARFPRTRFVWLMGADNLRQLPQWDRWTRIFHTVPIAVFDRPPYSFRVLGGLAARRFAARRMTGPRAGQALPEATLPAWVYFHNRPHPASATEWRRRHGGPPGR